MKILSMTGYGKALLSNDNTTYTVEIKSVNSKQLDLSIRMPGELREYELPIRNCVAAALQRGKVDLCIQKESVSMGPVTSFNKPLAMERLRELQAFAKEANIEQNNWLSLMMNLPDVWIQPNSNEVAPDLWPSLEPVLQKALDALVQYRADEGQALQADFEKRIGLIRESLQAIEPFEKNRIEAIKLKLRAAIEEWKEASFDANRFEQELFYYLEKLDITEEKVRLEKHCHYFIDTLQEAGAGKKLGFITQEIGREINTIGSKANEVAIQKLVVVMKDELEKIKEQLANVL